MNPKMSWRSGLALSVLLVSVALTACGYKSTTYSRASTAVALARYNANGTPDTANLVSGTGLVTTDVNTSQDDIAFAVVRQPVDGKIIAVGTSFTTPASIVVIRYNVDGTRDSTFGSNGITVTTLPSADASAFAATLQADGKLLVAGRSCPLSGGSSFLLLRYNTAGAPGTPGTLDAGFGTGGIVTTGIPSGVSNVANAVAVSATNDIGYSSNYANAAAIQDDEKNVVAGDAFVNSMGGTSDVAVLRYNTDGSLDTDPTTGFGGGTGIVTTNIGAFDNGFAVAVQPDNKIVVAGNADAGMGDRLALLRYNANGSLDADPMTGFGTGGIVTHRASGPSNIAGAFGVVLQPGGEIVVAGYD